jgi:Sulfatase-modifying factor enzyme 1
MGIFLPGRHDDTVSFRPDDSTDQANFNGTFPYAGGKKGVYRDKTTLVGSFPANPWGLYDMHGNVQQWCQDWAGSYPQNDVSDPQGPANGTERVLRGGCYSFYGGYLRAASRYPMSPSIGNASSGVRLSFFAQPPPRRAPRDRRTPRRATALDARPPSRRVIAACDCARRRREVQPPPRRATAAHDARPPAETRTLLPKVIFLSSSLAVFGRNFARILATD